MKRILSILFIILLVSVYEDPLLAQWIQTGLPGITVSCLAVSGTNLFAGTSRSSAQGVFLSTDNGTSWTQVNNGLTNLDIMSIANCPNGIGGVDIFAGTWGGGVFLSTDNGSSWTKVNMGMADSYYAMALAVSDSILFIGTNNNGVCCFNYKGTKNPIYGLTNAHVNAFAIIDTNIFAGTLNGVFLSTDKGLSWTQVNSGLKDTGVISFAVSGTNLFAGTVGGVFLSTNKGLSWTQRDSGLTDTVVNALVFSRGNLFAGTDFHSVFLSTNNGTSWTHVDSGMTNTWIYALAVSSPFLFTGNSSGGVWRRLLSEFPTNVKDIENILPSKYLLMQNYPNPFNPNTTISFSLPSKSFTRLKVFDIIGREIATLVNKELSAGNHLQQWNAIGMPSGVYFYRLQAGSFTETKKLILLR